MVVNRAQHLFAGHRVGVNGVFQNSPELLIQIHVAGGDFTVCIKRQTALHTVDHRTAVFRNAVQPHPGKKESGFMDRQRLAVGPDFHPVFHAVAVRDGGFDHLVVIFPARDHVQNGSGLLPAEMTLCVAVKDTVHDPGKAPAGNGLVRMGVHQGAACNPAFSSCGAEIGVQRVFRIHVPEDGGLFALRVKRAQGFQHFSARELLVRVQALAAQNPEILEISRGFIAGVILRHIQELPVSGFFGVQKPVKHLHKIADGDAAAGVQQGTFTGVHIGDVLFLLKGGQIARGQGPVGIYREFSALFLPPVRVLPAEEGLPVKKDRLAQNCSFTVQVFLGLVLAPRHRIGHRQGGIFFTLIKQQTQNCQRQQDTRLYQPEALAALPRRLCCCGTGLTDNSRFSFDSRFPGSSGKNGFLR